MCIMPDKNILYHKFLIMFFDAFEKFMNADISKKSYTKIKEKYDELADVLIKTRDDLESNPEKVKGLHGDITEFIWHIAEIKTNPMTKDDLTGLMLLQQAHKKFNNTRWEDILPK